MDRYDQGILFIGIWHCRTMGDIDQWLADQRRYHRVLPLLVQKSVFDHSRMLRAQQAFVFESGQASSCDGGQ